MVGSWTCNRWAQGRGMGLGWGRGGGGWVDPNSTQPQGLGGWGWGSRQWAWGGGPARRGWSSHRGCVPGRQQLPLPPTAETPALSKTTRFGRKLTMLAGGLCFLVGTGLVAGAVATPMLVVGRIVLGFGVGFACQVTLESEGLGRWGFNGPRQLPSPPAARAAPPLLPPLAARPLHATPNPPHSLARPNLYAPPSQPRPPCPNQTLIPPPSRPTPPGHAPLPLRDGALQRARLPQHHVPAGSHHRHPGRAGGGGACGGVAGVIWGQKGLRQGAFAARGGGVLFSPTGWAFPHSARASPPLPEAPSPDPARQTLPLARQTRHPPSYPPASSSTTAPSTSAPTAGACPSRWVPSPRSSSPSARSSCPTRQTR